MSAKNNKRVDQDSLVHSKISTRHLDRLAIVYVRQSTMHQVHHNQESTRLQYNLKSYAVTLGWPVERVIVIDDDLGRSGSSAVGRPGFQRLVAEVGLDHVGLILGLEMSRLARSCRDWHQLLEVCSLFGTLLADPDGIYDPSNYNDRLLLGLKGTMSEAELHILKQRMHAGMLAKAQRGELGLRLPRGYIRRPSGEVCKDPDLQVQHVMETIFAQFERCGSVHGVLRYLVQQDIKLPVRIASGSNKGDLRWCAPTNVAVHSIFKNPAYAGAYAYGRSWFDPRGKKPGVPWSGKTVVPLGQWKVCRHDSFPAYITWERFEQNLKQMASNCSFARGIPRNGPTLLAGILRCSRCNHRMTVKYNGGGSHHYCCVPKAVKYGSERCQTVAVRSADREIEVLVLRALEPASLELSLAVVEDLERERAREEAHWQLRRERVRYNAERARRQYNNVEPENRMVARFLERALEDCLLAEKNLEEEYNRFRAVRSTTLSDAERDTIRALAKEVPKVWASSTTKHEHRKAIVRLLIEEVLLEVSGQTERVEMTVRWVGGHESKVALSRPVQNRSQLSYYQDLLHRAEALRAAGNTWSQVAATLNKEGWRPAKRRETFTAEMVSNLGVRRAESQGPRKPKMRLLENEWTVAGLANELNVEVCKIYYWVKAGWINARKVKTSHHHGAWILWADPTKRVQILSRYAASKKR